MPSHVEGVGRRVGRGVTSTVHGQRFEVWPFTFPFLYNFSIKGIIKKTIIDIENHYVYQFHTAQTASPLPHHTLLLDAIYRQPKDSLQLSRKDTKFASRRGRPSSSQPWSSTLPPHHATEPSKSTDDKARRSGRPSSWHASDQYCWQCM